MQTWQSRLAKLVLYGERLPEPLCECFNARPPSGLPWPEKVPSSLALVDFYSVCDGGQMETYEFLPLVELRPGKEGVDGWPDDVDWDRDKGISPGRWVILGSLNHGPPFLWDAGKDDVAWTDFDGAYDEAEFLHKTLAQFFDELFCPSPHSEQVATLECRLWLETLRQLDNFD